MKKILLLIGSAALALSLAGCGSKEEVKSGNATQQSAEQVQANAPVKQNADPKEEYIQKLNSMKIKHLVEFMGEYGRTVSKVKKENPKLIANLQELHKMSIPKYRETGSTLKTMSVPNEYTEFHKKLIETISNAAITMEEMEIHLKDIEEVDHLKKSTDHYVISAKSAQILSQEQVFDKLQ